MNTAPRGGTRNWRNLRCGPRRRSRCSPRSTPPPHAIPISAPVRAGDRRIVLNLKRGRGSLARLRDSPQVALLVLAAGNLAFTARGTASVVEETMEGAPDYAAIPIEVEDIDDHRQPEFIDSGADRSWTDGKERRALGERVEAWRDLAAKGKQVSWT